MILSEPNPSYRARGLVGYDVSLTRRRSPVRIWTSPYTPTEPIYNLIYGLSMALGDLMWGFLILLFIYPYLLAWWLDRRRNLLLRVIGRKLKSQVITLIHTPSQLSLLGIPVLRMVDMSDMEDLVDAIRNTPKDKPIDLIIHVTGGMVLSTAQIARALKAHPARTRVIVPYYAMSGGTLISLGADEIIMGDHAVLGPLDPQLLTLRGPVPVNTLRRVVKRKGNKVSDDTMMLAELGEQATRQIANTILELLKGRVPPKKAKKIAEFLTKGDKTHDYPISHEEAKKLGLHIKTGVMREVYRLLDTYKLYKKPGVDVLYK